LSSVLAPDIPFFPEAAIVGARSVILRVVCSVLRILVIAIVACLPALRLFVDRRFEVLLVCLVFVLADSKWVAQIVHTLWVMWLRNVRLEAFAYFFSLSFLRIRVYEMLVLDFVPGWSTFLARADAVHFFGFMVFNDEIDELTLIKCVFDFDFEDSPLLDESLLCLPLSCLPWCS
jgi:hypothetical protein